MKKGNIIHIKSYQFAIRIVNLSRHLQEVQKALFLVERYSVGSRNYLNLYPM